MAKKDKWGIDRSQDPPEPGTRAWAVLCRKIHKAKGGDAPLCGMAGGRRTDRWPCESPYTMKNGLCKKHGGKAKTGMAAHNFKHGRTTMMYKVLPHRLRDAYEASAEDAEILSLRAEIAMTDARTMELLEQLSSGESGEAWRAAGKLASDIRAEAMRDDPNAMRIATLSQQLSHLAENGVHESLKWQELQTNTDHRRKLTESERGRLRDLNSMLSAEEALLLMSRLVDSAVRHMTDREELAGFLYDVEALMGHDRAEARRAKFMLEDGTEVN